MLQAELHGKGHPALSNSEDYLTSAVFGHLRYIRPGHFWQRLLAKAMTVDGSRLGTSLVEPLSIFDRYTDLTIHFWPKHLALGEPDLILIFEGPTVPPLAVIIEVKLHAEKGNAGDHRSDQLMRYLHIDQQKEKLKMSLPATTRLSLIYLTPHDSRAELSQSLALCTDIPGVDRRAFVLQWQDVLQAATDVLSDPSIQVTRTEKTILSDVSTFLRRRRLEYFKGFGRRVPLENVPSGHVPCANHDLLRRIPDFGILVSQQARWLS